MKNAIREGLITGAIGLVKITIGMVWLYALAMGMLTLTTIILAWIPNLVQYEKGILVVLAILWLDAIHEIGKWIGKAKEKKTADINDLTKNAGGTG